MTSPADLLDEYLMNPNGARRARRLVKEEAEKLYAELDDTHFPIAGVAFSYSVLAERMKRYEDLVETLQSLFILGCHDADPQLAGAWSDALSLIADPGGVTGTSGELVKLKRYPALLLLYAGGIAAVAGGKYENLTTLLRKASVRDSITRRAVPTAFALVPYRIIDREHAKHLPEVGNHYTPVSYHLCRVLRAKLRKILPNDDAYMECFLRFEYLFGLASAAENKKQYGYVAAPVGSYAWEQFLRYPPHITSETDEEVGRLKDDWPPLRAGLFDGTVEEFIPFKREADESIYKIIKGFYFGWNP